MDSCRWYLDQLKAVSTNDVYRPGFLLIGHLVSSCGSPVLGYVPSVGVEMLNIIVKPCGSYLLLRLIENPSPFNLRDSQPKVLLIPLSVFNLKNLNMLGLGKNQIRGCHMY
jgi:hypothetical protein